MPDLRKKLEDALNLTGGASSDFDLNPEVKAPAFPLTPAAVLIGIRAETETVILTKRSARLKHHPGQIAFPGGKQDPIDATLTDAALREAHEEIGLRPEIVTVLGHLPPHQTVTAYQVTPVLALIEGHYVPVPEAGEVSEVFEVPLAHLLNTANYMIEGRRWQGRRRLYYTVPFGPYYIWGATACIMRAFAERMT